MTYKAILASSDQNALTRERKIHQAYIDYTEAHCTGDSPTTTQARNKVKQIDARLAQIQEVPNRYRHRDSFRANRILCYPGGFSITILRQQGFCILNTPEYKDAKISRSTAAQLLTGIRKGIRDLNQSREAAL